MNMQRNVQTSPGWQRNTRLGLAGLAGHQVDSRG